MRIASWFDDAVRDLRVAVRSLRKWPLLATGAVLTIALAIGATTSVFSMVRGVLLAPLDYPRPNDLYSVYTRYLPESGYDFEYFPISGPELVEYGRFTRTMSGVAAYAHFREAMNLASRAGEPERLEVLRGTTNLFHVLGARPAIGRGFTEGDGEASASCVAVLSDGLWRGRFGADRGIINDHIRLDGRRCTVVGVMPPGFAFPDEQPRLYLPLKLDPTDSLWRRVSHGYVAVARLAGSATPASAQIELDALRSRWSQAYPNHHARGHFLVLRPLAEDVVGDARTYLLLLFGAVAIVLLVVIVNVAGLMIAGSEARRQEFAVRKALGVGRARLVRQLLTESMLIVLLV